jgi:hypothetical protein
MRFGFALDHGEPIADLSRNDVIALRVAARIEGRPGILCG